MNYPGLFELVAKFCQWINLHLLEIKQHTLFDDSQKASMKKFQIMSYKEQPTFVTLQRRMDLPSFETPLLTLFNTFTINTYKQLQTIFLLPSVNFFPLFFPDSFSPSLRVIGILMQDVDTVLVSKKPNLSSHCFSINNCNAHARSSN